MTDNQRAPIARRMPLDPYSSSAPHLIGIVDTNALLCSIENDCRKGFRSRLLPGLIQSPGDQEDAQVATA